jgi:RND family efflux transporter MFP subunit
MRRIRLRHLLPVFGMLLIAGCSEPPPEETSVVARPVKTQVIGDTEGGTVRRFPARIDAGQRAQLAFRVSGTLQELPVSEGDRVEADQVVARLDDADYQLVVNERTTTFENARRNYERGRELVGKGAISQMDFDRLEAEFKNTRTALEAARQDLSYTRLTAPFAGTVARRYVQNFEEVQAKQVVMDLQDTSRLEVKFDVPESLIRNLGQNSCRGGTARDRAVVTVAFDDRPDTGYPLTFREVATRANPSTQTFEVTYSMARDEAITILPGMTANVSVDLSACTETDADGPTLQVPLNALGGDADLRNRIWVVDESTMTVQVRQVETGALQGDRIEVLSGLRPGERIVTAGAAFLAEGMPVTLLPQTEQASPRPDE